jgi:hypothetical protein
MEDRQRIQELEEINEEIKGKVREMAEAEGAT